MRRLAGLCAALLVALSVQGCALQQDQPGAGEPVSPADEAASAVEDASSPADAAALPAGGSSSDGASAAGAGASDASAAGQGEQGVTAAGEGEGEQGGQGEQEDTVEATHVYVHIGDATLTIRLADNSSAAAFVERLREGDVTVDMHDYGNFEKVGELGFSLPRNDEDITTGPGDVILYLGTRIVIYYDTNRWDFTRMGWVEGATASELRGILNAGGPNVTAVFSLSE